MKTKYAQSVELLSDDLGNEGFGDEGFGDEGFGDEGRVDEGGVDEGFGDEGSILDEEVDPFDEGASDNGFVTVELPMDILEDLGESIDEALGREGFGDEELGDNLGEKIGDEGLGEEGPIDEGGELEVEVEGEVPDEGLDEGLGEEVGDAVGDVVGAAEGIGDALASKNTGRKKESSSENSKKRVTASIAEETRMHEDRLDDIEHFKRGKISANHKTSLDVSGIVEVLQKQAGDSKLVQKNVQDDKDIKPISDSGGKSKMGHEDKLTLAEPNVPSAGAGATMGAEPDSIVPQEITHVPAGGKTMGHEDEQGYTPEKGHENTGGEEGAGTSRAASNRHDTMNTRSITDNLAERLIATASETKLDPPAPWEDDGDIQPVQENKDHPDTPEVSKIKPRKGDDGPDVPERGNESFMGHEEESIGDVPKSPDHHPEYPAGGGANPKYDRNERWDAEKQDHDKGTVLAGSEAESLLARRHAAEKLAGRMVANGFVGAEQISSKIAELSRYQVEQISDIEKSIFGAGKKGLDAVAKGAQTPLVINAKSNSRGDAAAELQSKLQSLFSLERQNRLADDDPDAQLRMSM